MICWCNERIIHESSPVSDSHIDVLFSSARAQTHKDSTVEQAIKQRVFTYVHLLPRLHETTSTNPSRTIEEALQTWCQITFSFANVYVTVCLCLCVCVCSGWCNNMCSLPHYTVLHCSKWVLSMFLHLSYTMEIIGNGSRGRGRSVSEEEEKSSSRVGKTRNGHRCLLITGLLWISKLKQ